MAELQWDPLRATVAGVDDEDVSKKDKLKSEVVSKVTSAVTWLSLGPDPNAPNDCSILNTSIAMIAFVSPCLLYKQIIIKSLRHPLKYDVNIFTMSHEIEKEKNNCQVRRPERSLWAPSLIVNFNYNLYYTKKIYF